MDIQEMYWKRTGDQFDFTVKQVAAAFGISHQRVRTHIEPREEEFESFCPWCRKSIKYFSLVKNRDDFSHRKTWAKCEACQLKDNVERSARAAAARETLRKRFAARYVEDCPECTDGILIFRRNNASGGLFIGCTNYPECKCRRVIPAPMDLTPEEMADVAGARRILDQTPKCPKCGGYLRTVVGKYGKFIGCSNFPACRYTGTLEDVMPAESKQNDFEGLGIS